MRRGRCMLVVTVPQRRNMRRKKAQEAVCDASAFRAKILVCVFCRVLRANVRCPARHGASNLLSHESSPPYKTSSH